MTTMKDLDELALSMPQTTKDHGYPAVLMRIPELSRVDRDELEERVVEAWLTRAKKLVAKAWLEEHGASQA